MDLFTFVPGTTPLLIDVPHAGTHIPDNLAARMTPEALRVPDTDWYQDRLYSFALEMGASMLVATHSRYVIDLNRPPEDVSLYPGRDTEGLLPLKTAANEPVYLSGQEPSETEKDVRRATYHTPYHAKLRDALDEIKARHGYALLWDAHSIKSELPRFFEGRLWDINLGTNKGLTCDATLRTKLDQIAKDSPYTDALDERYLGGYITRHYGDPTNGIHAVQLELSRITYMDEEYPFTYREDLAAEVTPTLRAFIQTMLDFKP